MKTRILINAVGAISGGGLRHVACLVSALAELDTQRRFDVLVRAILPIDPPGGNVRLIRVPEHCYRTWWSRTIFDIIVIPLIARKKHSACVVSLMNFGPIVLRVPHVIFQGNVLFYSRIGISMARPKERIAIAARRVLAAASMRRAAVIVTPSNSTKTAIRPGIPSWQAKGSTSFHTGLEEMDISSLWHQVIDMSSRVVSATRSFILRISSVIKGFDFLLEVAALLKDRMPFTIFLTIDRAEAPVEFDLFMKAIEASELQAHVVTLGNIPQTQIEAMFKACDLMIFPSLVESFGLPLIEAMMYGCPVVASDTAINRETCHDAALFYAPHHAMDAVRAIEAALNREEAARLISAGQRRLTDLNWSWEENARRLVRIIERIGA